MQLDPSSAFRKWSSRLYVSDFGFWGVANEAYNGVNQSLQLEEILSRHGLKPTDLDKECPERVRDEVAVKLDDWEMAGRYLEFTLEKLRGFHVEGMLAPNIDAFASGYYA